MRMPDLPVPADLPVPHAVLFDLDGTLVDTVGTRVEAWLETFQQFGLEPDRAFLAPLMGSDGRLLARMVGEHLGAPLAPGVDIELDRLAGERFGELNALPRPLPGVTEIVAHLDELGLPWAIATSSRPEEAVASVTALGLLRPPLVIDGGDVEHAKPAPDLLLKAAERLAVPPGGVWYVGDSRWDMQAAVAGGMVAIGVTTGATSADQLRVDGARATYDGLPGLLDALSQRDMPPGAAR
jgi:HAD superfamily hydrolase (TIGR01509 family)